MNKELTLQKLKHLYDLIFNLDIRDDVKNTVTRSHALGLVVEIEVAILEPKQDKG